MTEMREWWANVYAHENGVAYPGTACQTRRGCEVCAGEHGGFPNQGYARIHVRLKPEGAPKRYASEANRRAWETRPEECRRVVRDCAYQPEWLTP